MLLLPVIADEPPTCSCNDRACSCQEPVQWSGQVCEKCADDDHYYEPDDDLASFVAW